MGTRNEVKLLRITETAYQATAISATCNMAALIGIADFIIWNIESEKRFVCWGDMNGRYAREPRSFELQTKPENHYCMATMTDTILAIAQKSSVDIRNARTGGRIEQLPLADFPRTIVFSPDGKHLAVGTDNQIFVYRQGLQSFSPPICIHTTSLRSIVFSHDSKLMATCTKDNIVRAYRLDNLSIGCFQKYVEPLQYGKCRGDSIYPHRCFKTADIADIDLYPLRILC